MTTESTATPAQQIAAGYAVEGQALDLGAFAETSVGDLNGDGVDDVVVADNHSSRLYVMRNSPFIEFSTGTVDFGSQTVGSTSPAASVIADNAGVAPLDIAAVEVLGDGFGKGSDSCSARRLELGQTCEVEARFAPGEAGDHDGALDFVSNDPDGELFVDLLGLGLAPTPTPPVSRPPDTVAPAFSSLSLTANAFYVGSQSTAVAAARIPTGTTVRYGCPRRRQCCL